MNESPLGNLTTQVVEKLGRMIASGTYPPGATLPSEAQLCAEYGTSRTVLREAVKMLTAKGLLDAKPRRGTMVRPETSWNLADPDILEWLLLRRNVLPLIVEFADVRLAVEPAAAALAARRASPAALDKMRRAIERMRAAERGDDDPLASDIAFHVSVLEASENRFFWSLRHMIEVALRFSIRITNRYKGVGNASVDDHKRILDAILANDPHTAEAAMKALILEAKMFLYQAGQEETREAKVARTDS